MYPLETIVSRAKRRGFVYAWSDIYWWLANAWDLWPYGAQLRKNILDAWRQFFVQEQPNIVAIDGSILMHPKVWEASGHVGGFNDPLIDDKNTGERFRADKLIEDYFEALRKKDSKTDKEILELFKENYWVPNLVPDSRPLQMQHACIVGEKIKNPNQKKKDADRTDVRTFSLMLATQLWVVEGDASKVWLRPETAQAMFVNFRNVIDTTRLKLPFGLAQVGKAFRNEITPWNFLFRTREFEQMEIQMFLTPELSDTWFSKFQKMSWEFWTQRLWINKENLRNRDHAWDELAHYASQARDFEFQYPWWWGELQGIHDRSDYDVQAHQTASWKNLQYSDPQTWARFVPYVIELSMGLSRTILTAMLDAYDEEQYEDGNGKTQTRTVARFHPNIAPVKFAILPLIKKNQDQVQFAEDLFAKLSKQYVCEYDDGGAIGKRYRRQDEIGTPYCLTIDHDSVNPESENYQTVTMRNRDTMEQKRVKIEDISL